MKKHKLDHIVREYMNELGEQQISTKYPRLLQIAISGLRYINKKKKNHVKILRVSADDLSSNNTISLPNDYIKYVQIAVCVNGVILGLGRSNNFCFPSKDDCGNLKAVSYGGGSADSGTFLGGYSDSTEYVQDRDFGVGGGQNGIGYYRIYEDDGFIALSLNSAANFDSIYIEYLADISQIDGEYMVHPHDIEALKEWMYWKSIQRIRTYPVGEKQMAKRDFEKALRQAQKWKMAFNIRELVAAYNKGFKSGPR